MENLTSFSAFVKRRLRSIDIWLFGGPEPVIVDAAAPQCSEATEPVNGT